MATAAASLRKAAGLQQDAVRSEGGSHLVSAHILLDYSSVAATTRGPRQGHSLSQLNRLWSDFLLRESAGGNAHGVIKPLTEDSSPTLIASNHEQSFIISIHGRQGPCGRDPRRRRASLGA